MLKAALCLAVLLAAYCAAGPCPRYKTPEKSLYRQFVEELIAAEESSDETEERGDVACERDVRLVPGDTISQKFFDDHICHTWGAPPRNLTAFCSDFRTNVDEGKYYVMVATPRDLTNLRGFLNSHQYDFNETRKDFPPVKSLPSDIHFYSDDLYNFIECSLASGTWSGVKLRGNYLQFIPRGTLGNSDATNQLYYICPPVTERPGFSQAGSC